MCSTTPKPGSRRASGRVSRFVTRRLNRAIRRPRSGVTPCPEADTAVAADRNRALSPERLPPDSAETPRSRRPLRREGRGGRRTTTTAVAARAAYALDVAIFEPASAWMISIRVLDRGGEHEGARGRPHSRRVRARRAAAPPGCRGGGHPGGAAAFARPLGRRPRDDLRARSRSGPDRAAEAAAENEDEDELTPAEDEAAVLLGDLGAELRAGAGEAIPDPGGVVAGCEPRVRELQLQRHRLEPVAAEIDEEEQAQVVPQPRVDPVVVEEVAEVVEHSRGGAVEDVRRVPGDQ